MFGPLLDILHFLYYNLYATKPIVLDFSGETHMTTRSSDDSVDPDASRRVIDVEPESVSDELPPKPQPTQPHIAPIPVPADSKLTTGLVLAAFGLCALPFCTLGIILTTISCFAYNVPSWKLYKRTRQEDDSPPTKLIACWAINGFTAVSAIWYWVWIVYKYG